MSEQVDVISFGVDDKKKSKLDNLLRKIDHKTLSVREPEINDLFLKVAEHED